MYNMPNHVLFERPASFVNSLPPLRRADWGTSASGCRAFDPKRFALLLVKALAASDCRHEEKSESLSEGKCTTW